jgi:hypothetical protein
MLDIQSPLSGSQYIGIQLFEQLLGRIRESLVMPAREAGNSARGRGCSNDGSLSNNSLLVSLRPIHISLQRSVSMTALFLLPYISK